MMRDWRGFIGAALLVAAAGCTPIVSYPRLAPSQVPESASAIPTSVRVYVARAFSWYSYPHYDARTRRYELGPGAEAAVRQLFRQAFDSVEFVPVLNQDEYSAILRAIGSDPQTGPAYYAFPIIKVPSRSNFWTGAAGLAAALTPGVGIAGAVALAAALPPGVGEPIRKLEITVHFTARSGRMITVTGQGDTTIAGFEFDERGLRGPISDESYHKVGHVVLRRTLTAVRDDLDAKRRCFTEWWEAAVPCT